MLFESVRHEPLRPIGWNEADAKSAIESIVGDAETRFSQDNYWPVHPLDRQDGDPGARGETPLYHGACGVIWALHYLEDVGAAALSRSYAGELDRLLSRNREWLG